MKNNNNNNGLILAITFLATSAIVFSLRGFFNNKIISNIILTLLTSIALLGLSAELGKILKERNIYGTGETILGGIFITLFIFGMIKVKTDIVRMIFGIFMILPVYSLLDGIGKLINSILNQMKKGERKRDSVKNILVALTQIITIVLSALQILNLIRTI